MAKQTKPQVLIIGAGGIGQRHIRAWLATERVGVSIVEPDEAKRRDVAGQYPLEKNFADLAEANLGEYAAAVICAPANVHVPIAMTCTKANLPFLMEKPLAVTTEGVEDLLAAVHKKLLPARVAYVTRACPEALWLRQQMEQGRIGRVRMCYVNASQEFPKYRPDFQRTYYAREATGGGAILDGASHRFDLLLWLMGPVTEVAAMYDRLELPGVECEDSALILLRFRSGGLAQISMNQFQKPNVNTVEFIGTQGNLLMDMIAAEVRFCGDDSNQWQVQRFAEGLSMRQYHEGRFRRQAEMFLNAMAGRDEAPDRDKSRSGGLCPLTTLEEARESLRMALAAKRSYREKRIISLDEM